MRRETRLTWTSLLAAALCAVIGRGGVWQMPLSGSPTPLSDASGWQAPGVYHAVLVSPQGLCSTQAVDSLAGHEVAMDTGATLDGTRLLRLKLSVHAGPSNAVWVACGPDGLHPNGLLDGDEARLFVGVDHGRWGLRRRGMGDTVWASAVLPPAGGDAAIELSIDAATRRVDARVTDAAGSRCPSALTAFDPDWSDLSPDDAVNWSLARIELRGEGAAIRALSLQQGQRTLLILR